MEILKKAASLVFMAAVAAMLFAPDGAWVVVGFLGFLLAFPVLLVIAVIEMVRSKKELKRKVVSVVLIFFVFGLGMLWKSREEKKAEPVKVEKVVESAGCACSAGAWCNGPQGGIYCLKDDGQKKYKPKS